MSGPKVLIWDIETMSAQVRGWGPRWDFGVTDIEEWPYMLSVAWTWYDMETGEWEPVQFRRKAKGKRNDKGLVKFTLDLLSEADVAVAHNGDRFDIPEVMARAAYHRLDRPEPFINVDTRKMAKKLRLPSYKLNDIAAYFGFGTKVQHTGYDLWKRCENEDPEAWALMEEYNDFDVTLLARVFDHLRKYTDIPKLNMQQWTGRYTCTHCGSRNTEKRGYRRTKAAVKRNVKCNTCRNWSYFKVANEDNDAGEYR